MGFMVIAWFGEAVMLLPLSRCRHATSALLCLLVVAVGQLLCSATLSSQYQWTVVLSGCVALAGALQSLSWLLLLPAVLLSGFASSITLSSLLSVPAWWLIVVMCGAQRWLQCDSWETITWPNLLVGLLLCTIGCAMSMVIVGWRVKAACADNNTSCSSPVPLVAAPPSPPVSFRSSVRSYHRAPPSRLRVHRYSLSVDLSTASPVLSDTSSPAGRDSPVSSISSPTSSASYSFPLDFLPTERQWSPSQSPFLHLTDDTEDSDIAASRRRYYDAIALETEDSDDEQKDDERSRRVNDLSCLSAVCLVDMQQPELTKIDEAVATMPPSQPLLFSDLVTTPTARITATAVSCLSSAVCQSSRLLPLYVDSPYGLERAFAMGPYMIGVSATTVVCLILAYVAYSILLSTCLRSEVTVVDDDHSRGGPLRRSPSATSLLPKTNFKAVPVLSMATLLSPLFTSPLPFLFPCLLCLVYGAASAFSFAFFHQLLQLPDFDGQFGWYSTDFLNDHYAPITALAPSAIAVMCAALMGRLLDGPGSSGMGGVGTGRVVAVWLMSMLLGSLGNFWIISNGLIRV